MKSFPQSRRAQNRPCLPILLASLAKRPKLFVCGSLPPQRLSLRIVIVGSMVIGAGRRLMVRGHRICDGDLLKEGRTAAMGSTVGHGWIGWSWADGGAGLDESIMGLLAGFGRLMDAGGGGSCCGRRLPSDLLLERDDGKMGLIMAVEAWLDGDDEVTGWVVASSSLERDGAGRLAMAAVPIEDGGAPF
ncbi:hypothetical protein ACLOJK_039678 [Asimina triloba]